MTLINTLETIKAEGITRLMGMHNETSVDRHLDNARGSHECLHWEAGALYCRSPEGNLTLWKQYRTTRPPSRPQSLLYRRTHVTKPRAKLFLQKGFAMSTTPHPAQICISPAPTPRAFRGVNNNLQQIYVNFSGCSAACPRR